MQNQLLFEDSAYSMPLAKLSIFCKTERTRHVLCIKTNNLGKVWNGTYPIRSMNHDSFATFKKLQSSWNQQQKQANPSFTRANHEDTKEQPSIILLTLQRAEADDKTLLLLACEQEATRVAFHEKLRHCLMIDYQSYFLKQFSLGFLHKLQQTNVNANLIASPTPLPHFHFMGKKTDKKISPIFQHYNATRMGGMKWSLWLLSEFFHTFPFICHILY